MIPRAAVDPKAGVIIAMEEVAGTPDRAYRCVNHQRGHGVVDASWDLSPQRLES
jgi:hypothetical protein